MRSFPLSLQSHTECSPENMPKAKQFPNSSLNLECFRLGQELIFEWEEKQCVRCLTILVWNNARSFEFSILQSNKRQYCSSLKEYFKTVSLYALFLSPSSGVNISQYITVFNGFESTYLMMLTFSLYTCISILNFEPLLGRQYLSGSRFEQFWFYTLWGCLYSNLKKM